MAVDRNTTSLERTEKYRNRFIDAHFYIPKRSYLIIEYTCLFHRMKFPNTDKDWLEIFNGLNNKMMIQFL